MDVYNNIGYLISKCVDYQKGSFDQFSRKRWSTIKLIHDLNSGKGFQLNWGKAILEIITTAAKNFKASNCFDDDDEQKVAVDTILPLGIKICYLLEKLGVTLRDPRDIPGGSYVGRHQYQQATKNSKGTESSTVRKKRRSSSAAEQSVASSAPPQKKSKKGGKHSTNKQAAKLPKIVVTRVDDTTEKVVDTSVSVANQLNPDISKGVDLLAAAATLISEKSTAQKDTPVDDASAKTVVDTVMEVHHPTTQKTALAVLADDMSVDELEDTALLISMYSTENVEVQLAATAREHVELLQHAQPGHEASDIQKKSAEVQTVLVEEIQRTENALVDPQQVVHFLDSISDAQLFLFFC